MLRCALLLAFAGTVGALGSTQGLMRAREVSVARSELRQQLQRLLPQQQQDLGLLVPALKASDRTGFKAHLTRMVHNGGNARIKRCLEGLSVAGFAATEIQAWLQSASAPVPQSNILKTRTERAQLKANQKLPAKTQQERVQVEKNKRSAPEQAKAKPQSQLAEQKKDQIAAPSKPHPSLKSQPASSKTGFASEQKVAAVKHEEVHQSKHADVGKQQVNQQHAQAEKQVSVQKHNQKHEEVKAADQSTAKTKNDQQVQQEKSKHVEKQQKHELSSAFMKKLAAGKQKQDQKKAGDMKHVGEAKETKEHKSVGTHGSLRKKTNADEGMTRFAKNNHEAIKQLSNQAKEVEEVKQLAKENHEEVKELVKRAQVIAGAKPLEQEMKKGHVEKAEVVSKAGRSAEKVNAAPPQQPEQSKHLRQRAASSEQVEQHAEAAKSNNLPPAGSMAGSTTKEQHVASAQGKVHEDLKTVESDKQQAAKRKKKAALRKELSKRLAKGVQALSRVESLEKEEVGLKSTMSADEARMSRLEDALAEEIQARKKAEKENEELKAKVLEEENKSKDEAARLEAIEKHELDAPKDNAAARLEVLEEANGKFRSALAGAARRLINVESRVAGEKPDEVKVIRHEKHPGEPAL